MEVSNDNNSKINMNRPSLKINYIFRVIYDVVAVLIPFVTMPYVTRVLGPENCGIYSYTHANVTYFVLLSVLGTSGYGIRTIARNRENRNLYSKLFWEIELLTVVSSMVALLGFVFFYQLVDEYKYYYLILGILIVSALLDISWFYTGLERSQEQRAFLYLLGNLKIFRFIF